MATFGRYELVEQIGGTTANAVWSARLAGSAAASAPAYAVRVCRPGDLWSEEQIPQAVRSFLACARLQKELAETALPDGDKSHWAPVHDMGETPDAVWYATNCFAWPAVQLIRQRVGATGAGLWRVADGVTRALEQIKAKSGRSHGGMKASSILLDRSPADGRCRAFLSEPADPGAADALMVEAADLQALGRFLFEWVTRVKWDDVVTFDQPAWDGLGRSAAAWRALCRRLGDPNDDERITRVEDLRARLDAMAPRPRYLPLAAAAAAVVLLSAGGAAWVFHSHDRTAKHSDTDTGKTPTTQQGRDDLKTRPVEADPAAERALERAAAYQAWVAGITPPRVSSAALLKAWRDARDRQLKDRTEPDGAVKSILDDLRNDLEALERELAAANRGQTPAALAAAQREELYRKVGGNPGAQELAGLRQEYEDWLQRQAKARDAVDAARGGEGKLARREYSEALAAADAADKLDPAGAAAADLRRRVGEAEEKELDEIRRVRDKGELTEALAKAGDLLNHDRGCRGAAALRDEVSSRLGAAASIPGLLKTARDQVAQENDGAALDTLAKVLERDPGSQPAKQERDRILARQAAALTEVSALVDKDDLQGARDKVAELLRRDQNFRDGQDLKHRIEEKSVRKLLDEALARAEAGEQGWQDALKLLGEAEKIISGHPDAARLRRQVEQRVQDRRAVRLDLEQAARADAEGDFKGALARCNDAAKIEPGNPEVKARQEAATARLANAEALLERARGQLTTGDFAGAEATLAPVGSAWPPARDLLKSVRAAREQHDAAERAAQEQVRRSADALLAKARPLEEAGDPAKALGVLNAADDARVRALLQPRCDQLQARIRAADGELARGKGAYARQDWSGAREAFQNAAMGGNAEAMFRLGQLFLYGSPPNPAKAAEWFRRSADRGNSEAMVALAGLYESGFGVTADARSAADLYARAAGLNNPMAQSHLDALRRKAATAGVTSPPPSDPPRAGAGIQP